MGTEAKAAREGWLTSKDLCEGAGLTKQRISQLRRAGRLTGAMQVGGRWFFPHDTVESLRAAKGQKKPTKHGAPGVRAQMRAQGWLTTRDVADRLGVSYPHISHLTKSGKLAGTQNGSQWFYRLNDVETLRMQREQRPQRGMVETKEQMRSQGWLTAKQVAERLGVSYPRVFNLTKSGKLAGTQNGSQWFYRPNDVETLRMQRQERHGAMAQMRAEGWLTAQQVAERLGVSYPHISHLTKSGKLAGTQNGFQWFYRPDDVEALRVLRATRQEGVADWINQRILDRKQREQMRAQGWLTTRDVADRLGMTSKYVLNLARSGKLAATRTASRLFFRPDDVEALRVLREQDSIAARQQREQVPGATQIGGRWIFPRYAV